MSYYGYLIIGFGGFGLVIGYGYYFYRRSLSHYTGSPSPEL